MEKEWSQFSIEGHGLKDNSIKQNCALFKQKSMLSKLTFIGQSLDTHLSDDM